MGTRNDCQKTNNVAAVAIGGAFAIRGAVASLLALFITLLSLGCGGAKGEGFALYLLADDAPPERLAALSHLDIADTPLVSSRDIISYSQETHEMEVTMAAYCRVCDLEVPLYGRSFAVCVDRSPIYAGAFVVSIWSGSFDGVVIWKPLQAGDSVGPHTIRLDLGYPGPTFFSGQDPRSDPLVLQALEKADLLE